MGRVGGSYEVNHKTGKKKQLEATKPAPEVDGATSRLEELEKERVEQVSAEK